MFARVRDSSVSTTTTQLKMNQRSSQTTKVARLRVWIAMLAAIVACSGDSRSITGPASTSAGTGAVVIATVASVIVSPPEKSGALGASTQFTAVAMDVNGDPLAGQTMRWTSSDSTIVAVSSTGLAVNVGIGTATVFATAGNGTAGTAFQTVVGAAAVSSMTISPSQVSVGAGQTTHFTVTLKDVAGNVLSGRRVLWQSGDPSIMRVDSTGQGTPIGQGLVTITAFSAGVTVAAAADVSSIPMAPPGAVNDLTVVSTTDTSATVQFTQVSDGNGGAASYDVRAGAPPIDFNASQGVTRGTCATPVAGTGPGVKLTCTVSGLAPATSFNVQLIAFRGDMNANAVFGPVSNIAAGTTMPAASTAPVASVTITPPAATIDSGSGSVQFTAVLRDALGNVLAGRPLSWSSSNSAVATVSASGAGSGISAGTVTITATSGAASGTANLTVSAPASPPAAVGDLHVVASNDTSATLSFTQIGDGTGGAASYDLRFAVAPIGWASAASVARGTCASPLAGTASGAVTTCTVLGLTPGTTYDFQLIAFRGTLNVNAVFGPLSNIATGSTTLAPVASVTVSPGSASTNVGAGGVQFTAVLKDAGGNVLTGRPVTWSSSSKSVATVSQSGLASAVSVGSHDDPRHQRLGERDGVAERLESGRFVDEPAVFAGKREQPQRDIDFRHFGNPALHSGHGRGRWRSQLRRAVRSHPSLLGVGVQRSARNVLHAGCGNHGGEPADVHRVRPDSQHVVPIRNRRLPWDAGRERRIRGALERRRRGHRLSVDAGSARRDGGVGERDTGGRKHRGGHRRSAVRGRLEGRERQRPHRTHGNVEVEQHERRDGQLGRARHGRRERHDDHHGDQRERERQLDADGFGGRSARAYCELRRRHPFHR